MYRVINFYIIYFFNKLNKKNIYYNPLTKIFNKIIETEKPRNNTETIGPYKKGKTKLLNQYKPYVEL